MAYRVAYFAVALGLALSVPAQACTQPRPPVTVAKVASEGMLISGQVIQAFDPDKNQPEIIRANQVFVGEESPRDFVIYRSPSFFEWARKQRRKPNWPPPICPGPEIFSLGQSFDRLVLMPAIEGNGAKVTNKWMVDPWAGNVTMDRGLNMLIEEAKRNGRFQTRPPKSQKWGDCMECGAPKVP